MSAQVLVAGAGPTGLTLAIDLARRGVAVRVVEQAAEFFVGSRGDGIQPRTLEVFDDLGVLDAVLAAGSPQPLMRACIGGTLVGERRMSEWREPSSAVPYPNPWVLGQSRTEEILRERLAEFGVRVELSTALVDFAQSDDGVSVRLSGPAGDETVRVDYLVGADGGRSTVRKRLGIAFEGSTDDAIRMLLGDVRADALDHEYGYWFAEADAPMNGIALSPLPGGRAFQFAAPLDADVEPSLELLQGYIDRLAHRPEVVLTDLTWSTVWRPNIRLAQRFREGRVFLAGDAAHVHPPTGGQGMNTGIQDAYNLGWKLGAALRDPGVESDALLDTYETERRAVAASVLGLSTEILAKTVAGAPDAMERGENTHQLDITYRNLMPQKMSGESEPALRSGDRAPDATLRDGVDRTVRLFDLLRGPHETLVVFGSDAPVSPGPRVVTIAREGQSDQALVDSTGDAFRAYDAVEGTRVLIRPDGYIAERVG
ncbi:FAD-dependent monooxygenase [Nocardia sp. NPDC050406]|uniref:FAD-dependent monooxygenase n=1 Tax=Nocardia sp. NPDC050406 TaxID=3364318 RepID=UPI00378A8719